MTETRLLLRKGLCCASCYRLPRQMQSPFLTWGYAARRRPGCGFAAQSTSPAPLIRCDAEEV